MFRRYFYTDFNNYKIEFIKKKILYNNIYTCNIYNNLNILLLSFNLSELDIFNLIDNINEYLSEDIDIFIPISNINNIYYCIYLYQYNIDNKYITKDSDYLTKDILNINSFNNCNNFTLSIEITNTLNSLLDILLEIFNINL